MMKHTFYYILLLALAAFFCTACDNVELPDQEPTGETVTWRFGVLMPESRHATRAMGETAAFTDLHLAVFSEVDGVWFLEQLAEATAQLTNQTLPDQLTEFTVTLNKSSAMRKIHLIGNYPGLSLPFGDEGTLIGLLSVKDDHDVYWGCVTLNNGIGNDLPQSMTRIPLVRNFAKVELKVSDAAKTNFTLTGFALHNVPNSGTVAPYNTSGGTFANFVASDNLCQTYDNIFNVQNYEGNEPYDVEYIPVSTDAAAYHTPAADGSVAPFYIYERKNRDTKTHTNVIVKGKYGGSQTETFYKLDIIYHDDVSNTNIYYNLLRNFIYTIKINGVTGVGYDTLEEALDNPASNNISGSTEVGDFTNISDGTGRLFVSTTYYLFTTADPVDIYYQYRPDLINTPNLIDNTPKTGNTGEVTITAPSGDVLSKAAVVSASDEADGTHVGWRKITLTPNAPTGKLQDQKITVAAGNLQRVINLELRQPYTMQVAVTPKMVSKTTGADVTVSTTIPKNLPPSIFPLLFRYSTKDNTLYPLPGTGMYSEVVGSTYGFIYELDRMKYEEFCKNAGEGSTVTFDVVLQTNCTVNATDVYVDNFYFNRGTDYFVNPFTLGSINVSYQKVGGRNPQTIYNNGNKEVTVLLNGTSIGTAIVNGTTLVSTDFDIPDNYNTSDEVSFQFQDKYWWGNSWKGPATYTATCTVQDLMTETTLVFKLENAKTIEIPQGLSVSGLTESFTYSNRSTNVYPYNLQNNGSQTVTVYYDGNEIGEIVIGKTEVTTGIDFPIPAGEYSADKKILFRFEDLYCTSASYYWWDGGSWSYDWSNNNTKRTYTAEIKVGDLDVNPKPTLSFSY